MELIQVINLTKTYKIEEKENQVLKHFSYGFPSSGLFGVIGKSGSGKSTLLNMISLLDKPTSGDIYFNSENMNKWSSKRKIQFRNKDLGIIFQHYNLVESESVIYNISLPYLISGGSEKDGKVKATKLLESINYKKDLYTQVVSNLSGGEKQRVAILRALINNPKVILADEPTGALDSGNSELIMEMLKTISETKLVIVVTHNIELIKKYADKTLELKDGSLVKITNNELISSKRRKSRKQHEKK